MAKPEVAPSETSYGVTERTRLRRSPLRAVTDRREVHAVLDAGVMCHVGYVMDGQPYVTPTAYVRVGETLYWHGSSASKMIRHLEKGVPVCVTVALLDGLVLARSGFHSSFNYRSVMAFGEARLVAEEAEKMQALEHFVERVTPGRWAEMRPVNGQEMKATKVVAMKLDELSCKIRTGGPIDDEEDYALDIWAGEIPISTRIEDPLPDARLKPGVALPNCVGHVKLG